MDQIIENPGFQHLTEKILLNLPFKDVISLQLVNKTLKEILDDPMFWIKKWILKGLSKKNKDDWIKAIQLTKNTKLAKIIILYTKKVLLRNRLVDFPCHIDEKSVDIFSKFTNETAFQKYFEEAFEDKDSLQRIDAGSIQICIPLVKNPNELNVREPTPMLKALAYGHNNIVKILAPFIGNANDDINLYTTPTRVHCTPIQCAIAIKNTEAINLLAHFCDDYIFQNLDLFNYRGNLIHYAVIIGNAEAIKILAPFLKNPHASDDRGETPTQKAIRKFGPNHEIVQLLQTFQ